MHDDDDALMAAALEGARDAAPAAPASTAPALRLGDLLADGNNEVVLLADGDVRELTLTGGAVVGEGRVDSHVTATGDDVSGYRYVTFADGLTLYYQDGFHLILGSDEPA